jgi:pyruvate/2-oxoglutarate dehydrogenase complex dihydrolipoamide acyltransferase (E2) component
MRLAIKCGSQITLRQGHTAKEGNIHGPPSPQNKTRQKPQNEAVSQVRRARTTARPLQALRPSIAGSMKSARHGTPGGISVANCMNVDGIADPLPVVCIFRIMGDRIVIDC